MESKNKKERVIISFDYALKRLLRHKADHEILEGFLSELLYRSIKIKTILESESNADDSDDKQNRVDLLAEDTDGELIIIEVQYQYEIDFLQRMLFATSKSTTEYIVKGDDYGNIRKIYSINIIYFPLGKGDDYIYHGTTQFIGIHTRHPLQLTTAQRNQFNRDTIAELFPEYYILNVKRFDDVAKNTLDEWIYYLKNNVVKDNFTAKGLRQVRTQLDYDKLSPEEKRRYDKERDRVKSWDNVLKSADLEIAAHKGEIEKQAKALSEKDKVLFEKDKALAIEKERSEKAEAEKEKAMAEIAELKRLLAKK